MPVMCSGVDSGGVSNCDELYEERLTVNHETRYRNYCKLVVPNDAISMEMRAANPIRISGLAFSVSYKA